ADRDQRKLNLGYAVIRNAVCELAQVDEEALGESYMRHSDVGDVIEEVLQGHTHPQPTSLPEVHQTFVRVYEQRTVKKKTEALRELLDRLTPREAKYIGKILTGDLRIGLRAGLVEEGIAKAFSAPLADVSWASMLTGDLGEVALLARRGALRSAQLRLMHPLQFMLASPEEDAAAIMRRVGGEAWVEDKYDGIRGQLHKEGDRVVLYSRDLNEVTAAFPEVVAAAGAVPHDVLLDGELLAYKDGAVLPFFELQHRLGRKVVSAQLLAEVPVIFVAFDVLYLDGRNLLTEPLRERRRLLEGLDLPSPFMLAYLIRALDAAELDRIFDGARQRNNEGLMVKDPESHYTPGRRGLGWLKLKKALATLDVVVTGVEVGHGKRKNVLSDYTFDRLFQVDHATGLWTLPLGPARSRARSRVRRDHGIGAAQLRLRAALSADQADPDGQNGARHRHAGERGPNAPRLHERARAAGGAGPGLGGDRQPRLRRGAVAGDHDQGDREDDDAARDHEAGVDRLTDEDGAQDDGDDRVDIGVGRHQ
ncbi:MAG: ATP-dependent DNA ligase, partial [Chloroflexi bacterium]